MIALLFWTIPFLAWVHAKGESGSAASAFPFRLLDIQPSSKPGVVVQTIAFLLLIVAPFVSAVHFWQIVGDEGKVCQPNPATTCEGIWSRPVKSGGFWDHTYRLTDGTTNRGPSYEPVVEPMLALALLAVALGFVVLLLREMYRAQKRSVTVSETSLATRCDRQPQLLAIRKTWAAERRLPVTAILTWARQSSVLTLYVAPRKELKANVATSCSFQRPVGSRGPTPN